MFLELHSYIGYIWPNMMKHGDRLRRRNANVRLWAFSLTSVLIPHIVMNIIPYVIILLIMIKAK